MKEKQAGSLKRMAEWALAVPAAALMAAPAFGAQYANLKGEVLLDNARVYVEKFTVQPGQFTGRLSRPGEQLLVFVKGGVLTSQAGRSTLWRDGRVVWVSGADGANDTDGGSINTGKDPIVMIWVTLKPQRRRPPPPAQSPSIVISTIRTSRERICSKTIR